ncbi:hypothetical protein B0O99DRAFT_508991, partial [Bisporella sp. PMI_857]
GNPGISFRHTEPTQGNHSGSWTGTGEGQQYFQESITQGLSLNGFSDSFNSFPASQMLQPGQVDAHGPVSGTQWNAEASSVNGEAMSRLPSQDSVGAHVLRNSTSTSNSYDQDGSARIYPNLPQGSYMSSARSDITGRSSPDNLAVYTPRQNQHVDLPTYDNFPYSSGEDFPENQAVYTGASYDVFATTTTEETFMSLSAQAPMKQDSIIYSANPLDASPIWEGPGFSDSRRSSPTLEDWTLPGPQMASATSSPTEYSPVLEGLSPTTTYTQDYPELVDLPPYTSSERVAKKPVGPRVSKVTSDIIARSQRFPGAPEASDESLRFVGRTSLDVDNTARDHHLYHNVRVRSDGLYHCPWEGQEGCGHKPEKLKCNYDKFVDSHLKPYRCKVSVCENSRFSSTACLLRHEREAHGMHGHGEKPYTCTYEGCDRGIEGNGFPRHWNLRDHMRRVHNHSGPTKSSASDSPPPSSAPPRGKNKRKAEVAESVPAKRIATPPVVMPKEPSLLEHYHESQRKLLDVVKQLHDPKNANNMDMLRNAGDCIKMMAQTTQRINSSPAMSRNASQQSG